jgi:hypothetical protein
LDDVESYPDAYEWIDDVLKKDKLIYNLSLLNADKNKYMKKYRNILESTLLSR